MIADVLSNKKCKPIVTELYVKGKKLSISLAFITQSYFAMPKNIKFYILFSYEISKQTKNSGNCI